MKFLIVADPVESLTPASDTGLSMLREALLRNHAVYWATAADLRLYNNQLFVRAACAESCPEAEAPRLNPVEEGVPITSFDGIWIRKDPPLNADYISLCWLLAMEEARVPIINSPTLILRYHEKLLPYEALRRGYIRDDELIPTYFVTGEEHTAPPDFPSGPVVSKPWLGYGGYEVDKWGSLQEALKAPHGPDTAFTLYQPFLSRIFETGDRRIIFIDGDYVGDVVRLPPEGSIRANLVQGGQAVLRKMTAQEKDLTKRVGQFLKELGIHLAGADYIDGKLTEVNITAPTGFEALAALGQPNPRVAFCDLAESLARERRL